MDHGGLDEEIEVLEAIYVEELDISKDESSDITQIMLQLHPATGDDIEQRFVCMTLVLGLTSKYPDDLPDITIRNPRGIAEEEIVSLREDMRVLCEERRGSPMLYELIELAKDSLTAGNIPHCLCMICLEHFHEGEKFTKTECYHYFHEDCLSRYVSHITTQTPEVVPSHTMPTEPQSKIVCPVCRECINVDISDLSTSTDTDDFIYIPSDEIKLLQDKMSAVLERQKACGGIIDVEAEKNKFLVTNQDRVVLQLPQSKSASKLDTSLESRSTGSNRDKSPQETRSNRDKNLRETSSRTDRTISPQKGLSNSNGESFKSSYQRNGQGYDRRPRSGYSRGNERDQRGYGKGYRDYDKRVAQTDRYKDNRYGKRLDRNDNKDRRDNSKQYTAENSKKKGDINDDDDFDDDDNDDYGNESGATVEITDIMDNKLTMKDDECVSYDKISDDINNDYKSENGKDLKDESDRAIEKPESGPNTKEGDSAKKEGGISVAKDKTSRDANRKDRLETRKDDSHRYGNRNSRFYDSRNRGYDRTDVKSGRDYNDRKERNDRNRDRGGFGTPDKSHYNDNRNEARGASRDFNSGRHRGGGFNRRNDYNREWERPESSRNEKRPESNRTGNKPETSRTANKLESSRTKSKPESSSVENDDKSFSRNSSANNAYRHQSNKYSSRDGESFGRFDSRHNSRRGEHGRNDSEPTVSDHNTSDRSTGRGGFGKPKRNDLVKDSTEGVNEGFDKMGKEINGLKASPRDGKTYGGNKQHSSNYRKYGPKKYHGTSKHDVSYKTKGECGDSDKSKADSSKHCSSVITDGKELGTESEKGSKIDKSERSDLESTKGKRTEDWNMECNNYDVSKSATQVKTPPGFKIAPPPGF